MALCLCLTPPHAYPHTLRAPARTQPHLRNINEDPQLSGLVRHVIAEGASTVGRATKDGSGPAIALGGVSIAPEHAVFTRAGDAITLRAAGGCQVLHLP